MAKRSINKGMTERVRPQATGSAAACDLKVAVTGATYTLVGDWPLSQSPERRAGDLRSDAVSLFADTVRSENFFSRLGAERG